MSPELSGRAEVTGGRNVSAFVLWSEVTAVPCCGPSFHQPGLAGDPRPAGRLGELHVASFLTPPPRGKSALPEEFPCRYTPPSSEIDN